jgi:hypothetical protein
VIVEMLRTTLEDEKSPKSEVVDSGDFAVVASLFVAAQPIGARA